MIKDALHKVGELRSRAELAYDQYVAARDALDEIHASTSPGIKLSAEVDEIWLELGSAPVDSELVVSLLEGVVTKQADTIMESWREISELAATVVNYCEQAKAAAEAAATSPVETQLQLPQTQQLPPAPPAPPNLPPAPGAPAPHPLQPPQPRVNQI